MHICGVAEVHGGQILRVDPEHGDVGNRIGAEDLRTKLALVGEFHDDLGSAVDHVRIGEHDAIGTHDETGALAAHRHFGLRGGRHAAQKLFQGVWVELFCGIRAHET
jgi:hypothetical protein